MAPKQVFLKKLLHKYTVGIVLPIVREMGQKSLCPGICFFTNKDLAKKWNKLIIQRRELAFKPLHETRHRKKRKMKRWIFLMP